MLRKLTIKNYALIDQLDVQFTNGFTIITGETGAGKSILLGGLSLILGKRADLSALRDKEKKCIVEAEFSIENYKLKSLFKSLDIDYEEDTIIRREVLPSGKSRAFINDSPVNLQVLSSLGTRLMDIHSQHQTLELTNNSFQLRLLDALGSNKTLLKNYKLELGVYRTLEKELSALVQFQSEATKEHDYNTFLYEELAKASLKEGMLVELEEQQEQLANVERILENMAIGHHLINGEETGILSQLTLLKQASVVLANYGGNFSGLDQRVASLIIELDDIEKEISTAQEEVEVNPQLLEETEAKLQNLYALLKKHQAQDLSELINTRDALEEKVSKVANIESSIEEKQLLYNEQSKKLQLIATNISASRNKVVDPLKKKLEQILSKLGMPNATFKITLANSKEFKDDGKDDLDFLFAANKGTDFGLLKKVASGGELSRIMLAIKSILASYENLPTIMFDEIDTGVSGEISAQMANIMSKMGVNMQVFSITHLPQVAAKGNSHFKVSKQDKGNETFTNIVALNKEERVKELAQMLGGNSISDAVLAHARELLN